MNHGNQTHPHPEARPNQLDPSKPPRFELTLLIPKTAAHYSQEPALKNVYEQYKALVIEKYGADPKKHPKFKVPFLNGDEFANTDGCEGHWMLRTTATAKRPPLVLNRNKTPMGDKSQIYGGCFVDALVHVWHYDNKAANSKGFSIGLDVVRFLEDGEPFGGTVDVESAKTAMPDLPDDGFGGMDDFDDAKSAKPAPPEDFF